MGRLPRLRLRHKLAVAMSVAALLPVVVASWVAVSVVLRSLESGLRHDTERQLHVGLNLLLRNVERLGQVAVRLSTSTELSQAMRVGPDAVEQSLAEERSHLPSSLVQVADDTGTIIAKRVVGGVGARFTEIGVQSGGPVLRAGLSYERRVTIVSTGDVLVVRAVAPIVDASYLLQGVVVVSVPLDAGFADKLKGALGTDVLIFAGVGAGGEKAPQAMSTFVDRFGARVTGVSLSSALAEKVAADLTVFANATILDREYALGYAPLHNLAGDVVGVFAVAAPRAPVIDARRAATGSLVLGAAGAFVFALGLAGLLSRRLTRPLAHLHRGALAIARGDLETELRVKASDEIGDLSQAFADMTDALKVNQRRLAARMREIVALHDAGRAVSSVLDTNEVLTTIVDSVARVFRARLAALWRVAPGDDGEPVLTLGAVRAQGEGDSVARAASLEEIALAVARSRHGMRIAAAGDDPTWSTVASGARVTGSLIAAPLERKGAVLGVVVVGRAEGAKTFGDAESDLLDTFGDQAATAIENAGLYQRLRAFNEQLEAKVELRTRELVAINGELGRALEELQETQAQLILSERLAGLGQLVASVAHEINSPSAAIRGSADAMAESLQSLFGHVRALPEAGISGPDFDRLRGALEEAAPAVATARLSSPVKVRRRAKANAAKLLELGVPDAAAHTPGRTLAALEIELAADGDADAPGAVLASAICAVIAAGTDGTARARRAELVASTVADHIQIHKSANTIQNAIRRIQRIVGALKSYSHLDQDAGRTEADIHDGIENTLAILAHAVGRGINISRAYGDVPHVPVFVDELNQVWTNLIHNAVQALDSEGTITIETEAAAGGVVVRIVDDGPGIPEAVMPRIFEPFYTTKPKGQGTGLGLGITRQIVDKHGGRITCQSEPGRTAFEVWLPTDPSAGEGSGRAAPGTGAG